MSINNGGKINFIIFYSMHLVSGSILSGSFYQCPFSFTRQTMGEKP